MRFSRTGKIACAAMATALLPSAAMATFKYTHLAPDVATMVPMNEYEPPLWVGGLAASGGGVPGPNLRTLLAHAGVKQCLADGKAVLVQKSGAVGCWSANAIERHLSIPRGDSWPVVPGNRKAADLAFGKCLKRAAISITLVRNVVTCIDTPPDVLRLAVRFDPTKDPGNSTIPKE